ncbi:hypothetical protein ACFXKX_20445 [Streptomyces scopuliridis]|uniref:hypothetical protein n=1 Tax=Streptomyces scopuliridis TaxID=452529 RepID=UPI0036CDD6BF
MSTGGAASGGSSPDGPSNGGIRLRKPGAGREPAAGALIGWLTDPGAPRLCALTGPAGAGKSHLLAWLVEYGGTGSERSDRRRQVHAVAPLAERGLRGAAWMLADDLGITARAPDELIAAVAADTRRTVLVLPELHSAYVPVDIVERLLLPLLTVPHVRMMVESRSGAPCTDVLLGSVAFRAVLDLADPRWTDRDGFGRWAASAAPAAAATDEAAEARDTADTSDTADTTDGYPSPGRILGWLPSPPAGPSLPSFDVDALTTADPHHVTAWLEEAERAGEFIGELGRAWLCAGQSLCRPQDPASRALVLLASMGDVTSVPRPVNTDPQGAALRTRLAEAAAARPWRVVWSRTRHDNGPGWPGPVAALSPGTAQHTGRVLLTGHMGDVRIYDPDGWSPRARLSTVRPRHLTAVFGLPDGTVSVLDEWGQIHVAGEIAPPVGGGGGLRGLIDASTDEWRPLREAVLAFPGEVPGGARLTAACAVPGGVVFGDEQGRVHAVVRKPPDSDPDPAPISAKPLQRLTQPLHEGPVTALAGIRIATNSPSGAESDWAAEGPILVYSGGIDGRVRLWGVGADPLRAPVHARPHSVTALAASTGEDSRSSAVVAVAWADGLVVHESLGTDAGDHVGLRQFRPGPPVRALCCTGRCLVIGTDEMIAALSTARIPRSESHLSIPL